MLCCRHRSLCNVRFGIDLRVILAQGGTLGGSKISECVGMASEPDNAANDSVDTEVEERNARRANPIDVHVGSRVRLRRMLLGMSQERLGERLGLTFQQVQKYEKGVNRIGASRLFDLAQVLGVPVQFFYDDAPPGMHEMAAQPAHLAHAGPGMSERGSESYIVEFLSTREGLELNRAFNRISDARVRRSIVELVRNVAGEEA
jgi:transcriptional regulator with XRE-family HTH domain